MWKVKGTLQRNNAHLNPFQRDIKPSQSAFTARLISNADLERHEERIYQPGYTPKAIRESIHKMLRESNPNQHLVDFQ
jgi:hypothetical protein